MHALHCIQPHHTVCSLIAFAAWFRSLACRSLACSQQAPDSEEHSCKHPSLSNRSISTQILMSANFTWDPACCSLLFSNITSQASAYSPTDLSTAVDARRADSAGLKRDLADFAAGSGNSQRRKPRPQTVITRSQPHSKELNGAERL